MHRRIQRARPLYVAVAASRALSWQAYSILQSVYSFGMEEVEDRIALIDLDGTVAGYDSSLKEAMRSLQSPNEPVYGDRYTGNQLNHGKEPSYVEARRKMIQKQPGFWRGLKKLALGFDIVAELRELGFGLHVLTKGPATTPGAWGEKLEWCSENLPDALVTISQDKSLVYGRVLVDDFPPYFEGWLKVRPRGLVVCVAHPWNERFKDSHPNILRYDGTNRAELKRRLVQAYERKGGSL